MRMFCKFNHYLVCLILLMAILTGCGGGGDENDFNTTGNTIDTCSFAGKISGGLNYNLNYDETDGCGVSIVSNDTIAAYGGLSNAINYKIQHENFQPGDSTENHYAHVMIHMDRTKEWQTSTGVCEIKITANEFDTAAKKVKISGTGTCSGQAFPTTSTGATGNITIEPFSFQTHWIPY